MRNNAPRVYAPTDPDILQSAVSVCTSAASLVLKILTLPLLTLTSHGFKRVLLAVVVLNSSWQIQKHFFLREDVASLGSLGGLQVSLTTLALAGLYAAWLIECVTNPKLTPIETKRPLNPVTLSAIVFLLLCVLSLTVAADATLGVFEISSLAERFLLYIYIVNKVNSREDVRFVVRVLFMGLIVQSVLMLAQAAGLLQTIDWYGVKARSDFAGDPRVSGTLGSPNPAAAYLAMVMVFAFSILLSHAGNTDKLLSGIALTLALMPLFFTSSRGGWISFLAGLITVLVANVLRARHRFLGAAIVMFIFLLMISSGPVRQRLFGDDNGTAASRIPLNKLAIAIIEDHPLLGVGSNNFSVAMQPYLSRSLSGHDFVYTVHNTYLRVWAETGVGGLFAFVSFLIFNLHRAFKVWSLRDSELAYISLGSAAAMLGLMIQMSFEPFRYGGENQLLWILAGSTTVMYHLSLMARSVPSASAKPA